MKKPLLNILIRFTDQAALTALLAQIQKQSYKAVSVLVSFTDIADIPFLEECENASEIPFKRVKVTTRTHVRGKQQTAPTNFFINRMLDFVQDGFVTIIDDDKKLTDRFSLSRIMKDLSEGTARVYPIYDRVEIVDAGVCFHITDLHGLRFDGQKGAGNRFIDSLKGQDVLIDTTEQDLVQDA